MEEDISEKSATMADVRNKVKHGINGEGRHSCQCGEFSELKELLAVQDTKQAELKRILANQAKKQDLILLYFQQLCPNPSEALLAASPSGIAGIVDEKISDKEVHALEGSHYEDSAEALVTFV